MLVFCSNSIIYRCATIINAYTAQTLRNDIMQYIVAQLLHLCYTMCEVMGMGKASTKAQNKYINKAYDRVNLTMPKGKKADITEHAQERGESLNGFINRAIDETMERDADNPQPKGE